MFRRADRGADPRWVVAAGTQIFTTDRETVVRLVREVDPDASERALDGVLIARSHPTGWFLWAVRRADLSGEELDHFVELVSVRVYLVLRGGPRSNLWRPAPGDQEWRSAVVSLAEDFSGLVGDLGT
jgi:hypothetical protein